MVQYLEIQNFQGKGWLSMNHCATLSLKSILLSQSQRVEMTEFVAFFGPGVRSNCRVARWDKARNNKAKAKTPITG